MTVLHVFDMDGTLLHGAASVELSRHLGTFEAAHAVEEAWSRGEITDVGFWERILPLWAGVTEAQIDAAFEAAPWIAGIPEVFADIAARGEHCIVISQSPQFFVSRLRRWGADATFGAGVRPGGRSGQDLLLTVRDKVDIVLAELDRRDVGEHACVAYGDSRSDMLLFQHLTHTVAVNGTPQIREVAATAYDGADLWGAYTLGRALVDGTPIPQQARR